MALKKPAKEKAAKTTGVATLDKDEKQRSIEQALKEIRTKFGDEAIATYGTGAPQKIPSIPTGSIALDVALGIGGFPRGRVVEIYGPESSGKTTVALHAVESNRARFYYTNALTGAYYLRTEGLGQKLRLHPGVLQSSPSYLWVGRHVDSATVQKLDKALQQLKRSGELERIYQRYEAE